MHIDTYRLVHPFLSTLVYLRYHVAVARWVGTLTYPRTFSLYVVLWDCSPLLVVPLSTSPFLLHLPPFQGGTLAPAGGPLPQAAPTSQGIRWWG